MILETLQLTNSSNCESDPFSVLLLFVLGKDSIKTQNYKNIAIIYACICKNTSIIIIMK